MKSGILQCDQALQSCKLQQHVHVYAFAASIIVMSADMLYGNAGCEVSLQPGIEHVALHILHA